MHSAYARSYGGHCSYRSSAPLYADARCAETALHHHHVRFYRRIPASQNERGVFEFDKGVGVKKEFFGISITYSRLLLKFYNWLQFIVFSDIIKTVDNTENQKGKCHVEVSDIVCRTEKIVYKVRSNHSLKKYYCDQNYYSISCVGMEFNKIFFPTES